MLLKLSNISKHYGSESEGTLRKVLDGLSLEIKEGESIAILGPSGSGKTTLLNIMGTLDRPDSGDVYFRNKKAVPDGIDFEMMTDNDTKNHKAENVYSTEEDTYDDITNEPQEKTTTRISSADDIHTADRKSELRGVTNSPKGKSQPSDPKKEYPVTGRIVSPQGNNPKRMQFAPAPGHIFSTKENLVSYTTKELDTFRNEKIGFVFQLHHLLPQCTLLENILIPTLTIKDKKIRAERLNHAKELMERVGIWEQRDQMPGHLSGGECQRAAVVRALINKPGLLLADEPTGALDEDNVSKLALLLLEINKTEGVTLVIVTHSVALASKMDTVYELKNGKLRLKNLKA